MNHWLCAVLVSIAGALGGVASILMGAEGFTKPRRIGDVWCPGSVSLILLGAFAAFASWAFYGSGAGVDLADTSTQVHLQLSALAGAFLIGVVGSKWISAETDKQLLRESTEIATAKALPNSNVRKIVSGSAVDVLRNVEQACKSET